MRVALTAALIATFTASTRSWSCLDGLVERHLNNVCVPQATDLSDEQLEAEAFGLAQREWNGSAVVLKQELPTVIEATSDHPAVQRDGSKLVAGKTRR